VSIRELRNRGGEVVARVTAGDLGMLGRYFIG
jgi:antitoxin (DNA-binding transcriptional repressor) of toxin-antitoxin stability system